MFYLIQLNLIAVLRLPVSFDKDDIACCDFELLTAQLNHSEQSTELVVVDFSVDVLDWILRWLQLHFSFCIFNVNFWCFGEQCGG